MIYMVRCAGTDPVSPRSMATALGLSASYLAKVTGMLVKAGVLMAHRGVKGGVTLAKNPEQILLLDIIQALQGLIVGNYCDMTSHHEEPVCAFHSAMVEVHEATLAALSKWTLADLAAQPVSAEAVEKHVPCRMECLRRLVVSQASD